MIPADSRLFTPQTSMPLRADRAAAHDQIDGKWPVWLRLATIVGLSAGLWTTIIWGAVSVFG